MLKPALSLCFVDKINKKRMINTQLAFITASALFYIDDHLDLDALKDKENVKEEQIEKAEMYSNNITVKSKVFHNSAVVIKNIKAYGVDIKGLYAAQIWTPSSAQDYSKSSYTTGIQTSSTSSMCHYNCHNQCHTQCHNQCHTQCHKSDQDRGGPNGRR